VGHGICVCKPTSRYQIRNSQYNATVGLILVTPFPFVRSVMQKKRNVTHGSLRDGDRNSEMETREAPPCKIRAKCKLLRCVRPPTPMFVLQPWREAFCETYTTRSIELKNPRRMTSNPGLGAEQQSKHPSRKTRLSENQHPS
jgi:hypothetical protein